MSEKERANGRKGLVQRVARVFPNGGHTVSHPGY